jgi:hypothetical protein
MKPQYRIRNGSEYNAGLKQRGSLTFWLEESVLEQWVVEEVSGKRGASILYSDLAMQTMAPLKTVYRLAGPVPIAIAMTRLQPEEPKP